MINMKAAIKNFISDAVPEVIMILLNLILLKLFYSNLGKNTYALYQIFSQFFAYLLLTEAGFSSAALVSLYKPIIRNDVEEISKKLSGIRLIFRKIGIIIISLGIVAMFVIPYVIKDNVFDNKYIYFTFFLYIIGNSLNYFFYTYRILYDAKQQKYVPNLIYQIGSIIKYVVEIVLLYFKMDFPCILISCIVCNLLTNLFMKYYALRKNKTIIFNNSQKDTSMVKDTKNLIVHKIGGVIANNVDIVIISAKLGLNYVAIYGAYNYILNEITKFTSKIGVSLYSIIGQEYFKNEKMSINENKFFQFNSFIFFLATIVCSSLIFSYNSFINLFYGSEMLADNVAVYLFIFLIYFQIIRITLNTYVNACGLFKETKICTISEAVINFSLSLILSSHYKIAGILFATIISYIIADFIIKPIFIIKNLHLFKIKEFYKEELKNLLCFVVLIILNSFLFGILVDNYIKWFIISFVVFICNMLLSCLYFKAIKRLDWLYLIIKCLGRKNEN